MATQAQRRLGWGFHRVRYVVGSILIIHIGLLAWCATKCGPVQSEDAHLASGISHILLGRFDLYRVNPPLVRMVAALPALMLHPTTQWGRYFTGTQERCEYTVGSDFAYCNQPRTIWLVRIARWTCVVFSLCGCCICYLWAQQLFGKCAGVFALVLWCFSPYILGHASTIMPDAHAAAVGTAAVYCFWRWLKKPQWSEAIVAGVVLGLAELCKFTMLVLYPLFFLFFMVYQLSERKSLIQRGWMRQGTMFTLTLFVSICIINYGYLFEGTFTPLENFRFQSMLLSGRDSLPDIPPEGANRFGDTWFGKFPVPLPVNMVQGIDTQRYDFERGLPSYLRGQWSGHGWWYYYLYALAIKVPLGTWCLVTLAIGATTLGGGCSASWRDEMVVFVSGLTILIFVSSQTGFSVHSRYVIPVLPFLFVWTSKVARVFELRPFTRKRLAMAATILAALAWSIGGSLAIYPHNLSYFNELAAVLPTSSDSLYSKAIGSRNEEHGILSTIKYVLTIGSLNAPRHLLNSNIDWGQDLLYLKDWLDAHPTVKIDGLAYYGSYPAALVNIPETRMPPTSSDTGPRPGWYALSVNYIYSRDSQYRYFLCFVPEAMVGYSIYIYHITEGEANRVRWELGLPKLRKEAVEDKVARRDR